MAKKPLPVDLYVGQRVRAQREALGITQEALGQALDISFQQVQKYEKGANRISASRLQTIARILKVPVESFFEGAPGKSQLKGSPPSDYVANFVASADGLDLIKAFIKIKDDMLRRKIVKLVEELVGEE